MFSALLLVCLSNGSDSVCLSTAHAAAAPSYAECQDLFAPLLLEFDAFMRDEILPAWPETVIEHLDAQCVSWTNS